MTFDFDTYRKRMKEQGPPSISKILFDPGLVQLKIKYSYEDDLFFVVDDKGLLITHEQFFSINDEIGLFFNEYSDEEIEQMNTEVEEKYQERENWESQEGGSRSPKLKSGFVYLMKSKEGYKIGWSGNPEARMKQIKPYAPSIQLIHTFEADNVLLAEQTLHILFEGARISGEWYDLTNRNVEGFKDITGFKDKNFLKSGGVV